MMEGMLPCSSNATMWLSDIISSFLKLNKETNVANFVKNDTLSITIQLISYIIEMQSRNCFRSLRESRYLESEEVLEYLLDMNSLQLGITIILGIQKHDFVKRMGRAVLEQQNRNLRWQDVADMGGAVSFQIVHHVAKQNRGPNSKRLEKQSDNILDVLATENNWFRRLLRNCLFTLQFSFEKAFCANHGETRT